MLPGIKVKVDASKLGRRLAKLEGSLRLRTPMLQAIGEEGVAWVQENFSQAGKLRLPGGWKKLRPNTVAAKGHSAPLIGDGTLAASFRYTIFGGTVRIRSSSEVAKYHEFGTKGPYWIPKKPPMPPGRWLVFKTVGGLVFAKQVKHPGLPRRPMLPTVDQFREISRKVVRAYVDGMVKNAAS